MLYSKSKSCPRTNYHIGHDPSMKYIITYYAVTTNESEWQNNRFIYNTFTRSI